MQYVSSYKIFLFYMKKKEDIYFVFTKIIIKNTTLI